MIKFILYNIRSAFNVGSILRTGEFLGFKDFYLVGYTPSLENRRVIKTSLGAEKNLDIFRVKRILPLLKKLSKEGFKIVSLECPRDREFFKDKICYFYHFKPYSKMAILLGNEVDGLNYNILQLSDKIVEIPRQGKIKESLNVAISFAIFTSYLRFGWENQPSKTI
ncbi:MAG: hypothetical protein NZ822_01325 [Patescibacteria group bacterium]|nr:hypothetical protein [Patescibacteria group bacterium]